MREILFRGKRDDNGEWVYGFYVRLPDAAGSVHMMHVPARNPDESNASFFIDPKTLGQFTGLTDNNGTKIFEGDICHFYGGEYYSGCWEANCVNEIKICHECLYYLENSENVEVIGNIYDNPELIGGAANG